MTQEEMNRSVHLVGAGVPDGPCWTRSEAEASGKDALTESW